MGEVYGGGAIKNRRTVLLLVAVFAFIGARIGGGPVAHTIGSGLIDPSAVTPLLVLVVLGSACTTLFVANLLAIPLSTSEVTVGSIVGLGLILDGVYFHRLFTIACTWIILPAIACAIVVGGRLFLIPWIETRLATSRLSPKAKPWLVATVIAAGCYQALASGMNNVANAVGPLLAADMIDANHALLFGGIALGAGALLLGGRVLETNGKRITRLSLLDSTLVASTGGTLVLIASLMGIPVPLTQVTTLSIIGIGWAKRRRGVFDGATVTHIFRVWLLSPFASLFLTMGVASAVMGAVQWPDAGWAAVWIALSVALLIAQGKRRLLSTPSPRRRPS